MLAKNPSQFEASGHVTLWTGDEKKEWVFGGHHYARQSKGMYFWELK